ncbi:MAG: response regulator [Chloroflexi bacterium]|nr:response regulator [Chloroflexota bacterium]
MEDHYILIVDDDPIVSRALQQTLTAAGHRAMVTNDRATGLATALDSLPRLLLLDIELPDGTGWDLLADLREARPNEKIPVIVVSANRITRAQLREQRVERLVSKPFDMRYLVETVQKTIAPA